MWYMIGVTVVYFTVAGVMLLAIGRRPPRDDRDDDDDRPQPVDPLDDGGQSWPEPTDIWSDEMPMEMATAERYPLEF